MAFLDVVLRVVDKLGTSFVEPRIEDGHGSDVSTPTHVSLASAPLPTGAATEANQLPNDHDVTVSNQVDQPLTDTQLRAVPVPVSGTVSADKGTGWVDPQTDALTDTQLRAAPVPVSGTVVSTPSGTQDVNVTDSVEIEVTLNGEEVALTRGDSNSNPLYVGWSGSQQVTVQGSVQVITQGNSSLSVDAAQDGNWSVDVDNFPTDYATAAKQLPNDHDVTVTNFPATQPVSGTVAANKGTGWVDPQTDALTDTQLRATPIAVENLAQLVPEQYDEIVLSYTGDDLTGVVYKSASSTVATLTLGYTSGKLTSVVRS